MAIKNIPPPTPKSPDENPTKSPIIAVVIKLNGIFAFAVWEIKRKRLFLARDRIGVKPLFYKIHNGGIIFSSEILYSALNPTKNMSSLIFLIL